MSAVDELKTNIDDLKKNIRDLATPGVNVQDYFLTKRQTAKKIMLKSSPEGTTEEEVHLIQSGIISQSKHLIDTL